MYAYPFEMNMVRDDFEIRHVSDVKGLGASYHYHDFYEILFFLSEYMRYVVESKTYTLRAGDVLLTNSRDFHRFVLAEGNACERYVIWLNPEYVNSLVRDDTDLTACFEDAAVKPYKLIRANGDDIIRIKNFCEKIMNARANPTRWNSVLQHAYIMELMVLLNRLYFDDADNIDIKMDIIENEKINSAVKYINQNIHERLSLDSIGKELFISKYYFNRMFKYYTGLTTYQYIMKKRLSHARVMLMQGASGMESCLASGFNDYSNFIKAFKREFGQLPRELMK